MKKTNEQEQIGFHKGALDTLVREKQEFVRLLNIVDQFIQMHLKALKEMGVDLVAEAKKLENKKTEILEKKI